MEFLSFLRANTRALSFGALHALFSAPGQTFVIGLFVAAFSDSFGLTPAAIGGLYLVATLGSAATLILLGHWIDHMRLVHYSAAVVIGLSIACLAAGSARGPATLFVAIYLLRLTGQGLMTHVEATATARMFSAQRGRALSITALGGPAAEMIFPPLAVAGIAVIGWRPTYYLFGGVALLIVLPLTQWLLRGIPRPPKPPVGDRSPWRELAGGLALLARSRYVWAVLPAAGLFPFAITGIVFQITTIAEDRGWSLELVAIAFPISAVTQVIGLMASGPLIDAISARRLFLFQSLPLIAGMAILAGFSGGWALFLAFGLIGLSGGLTRTTSTAMWAETFGTEKLGTIRSAVVMYMVLTTALAPFLFGALLAAGVSVTGVLVLLLLVGILAVIPPFAADKLGLG